MVRVTQPFPSSDINLLTIMLSMDIASLTAAVQGQPDASLMHLLGRDSSLLRSRHGSFCNVFDSRDSVIISFYETQESETVIQVSTRSCQVAFREDSRP